MKLSIKKRYSIAMVFILVVVLLLQSSINTYALSESDTNNNFSIEGYEFQFLDHSKLPAPRLKDEIAIKNRLEKIGREVAEIWSKEKNMSAVNNYLRANDFIILNPIKKDVIGTVSSSNNDINISVPTVSYDNWSGYYNIFGNMTWKRNSQGVPMWAPDTFDAGDADLVALNLNDGNSNSFKNKYYSLYISDKNGNSTGITNAESWGNSGVVFRPQDEFTGNNVNFNYNIDSYSAMLTVEYVGSETNVRVYNTYAHTWKTSQITGYGFQLYGFNVNFSSSTYAWKATSSPKYFN